LASPHLGGVRELDLGNNRLTGRAVAALAGASFFARLTALSLRNNALSAAALRALLAAAPAGLRRLDVQGNDLGREAAGKLAAWGAARPPGKARPGPPPRAGDTAGRWRAP